MATNVEQEIDRIIDTVEFGRGVGRKNASAQRRFERDEQEMNHLIATKKVVVIDHDETGKRARALRKKLGLSVRAVAGLMGISAVYLSDLERGNREWSDALAERFWDAVTS